MNIYIYGNDARSHIRRYVIIYTHIHIYVSFFEFKVYMHTGNHGVDRPKLKESFTAMDVVLNLSWDVEVVGVGRRQQKTLRELVVFLRPKKKKKYIYIYITFLVARLSFEIRVS